MRRVTKTNVVLATICIFFFILEFNLGSPFYLQKQQQNKTSNNNPKSLFFEKIVNVINKSGLIGIANADDVIPYELDSEKIHNDVLLYEQNSKKSFDVSKKMTITILNNKNLPSNLSNLDSGPTNYNAGFLIRSTDYRFVGGGHYLLNDSVATGLVFEYGYSKYDATNSLYYQNETYDNSSRDATVLGQFYKLFSEYTVYMDAAFSFGKTDYDIDSNDITSGMTTFDNYTNRANYRGVFIGSGYYYPLNKEIDVDTSIRYFYTSLEPNDATNSSAFQFDSSTSSRIQLKKKINYNISNHFTLSLAGIFEQQLDNSAKASVDGIPIHAQNENGSTGIIELGVQSNPIKNNNRFGMGLTFRAYSGQRNGVNTFASAIYRF